MFEWNDEAELLAAGPPDCPICDGSGEVGGDDCSECRGDGRVGMASQFPEKTEPY